MKKQSKSLKNKHLKMNLQLFAEDQPNVQSQSQNTDALLGAINQMQQQIQTLATPQKTAEQVREEQEALIEEFNSNPNAVLNRFQQQAKEEAMNAVNPMINELTEKLNSVQWSDAVRRFAGQNPNAQAYSKQMNEIIRTNPMIADIARKDPIQALNLSLSQAMTQTIAPNGNVVEGVLGNEEMRKQIASNPELKKQIIDEYLASLNGGQAEQIPPIAGNGSAAPNIAPTPVNKPQNLQDAKKSALAYFNSLNQAQMQ